MFKAWGSIPQRTPWEVTGTEAEKRVQTKASVLTAYSKDLGGKGNNLKTLLTLPDEPTGPRLRLLVAVFLLDLTAP